MSIDDKDPFGLGSTLAQPLQAEGGTFKTVSGVEALETNIRALVLTEKGDHVMHPDLGWPKKELIVKGDLDQISQAIRKVIVDEENRIDPSNLEVKAASPSNGVMEVAVTYSIKNDTSRRTLTVDVPLDS